MGNRNGQNRPKNEETERFKIFERDSDINKPANKILNCVYI